MTDYAGDPTKWPETFRLISNATRGFADRITAALEALGDRTAFNRARLLTDPLPVSLFGAQQASLAGVPRFTPWPISPPDPTYERGGWHQTDVLGGGGLWWWIPIRFGVNVTMIAASLRGDDGTGSNPGFPAAPDRPLMRIYRQPTGGGDAEFLLLLADETTSQAQYEAHHTIPLDPGIPFEPPLELASGEYLIIEFVGHKGANVGANTLKLYGIEITTEAIPAP
jgi:hypothetical protein